MADCTDLAGLEARLAAGSICLYAGFDPTSDSLHVGNLVPLLCLHRFQRAGNRPIAVAGGATGSIGDPSGKAAERKLLTSEELQQNIGKIQVQLKAFLDFESKTNPAILVNNADWTAGVSYLQFLREIGKHFSVNMMVAKESVRARMEDREAGISYTEFSYMLLQAFDFYHLRQGQNCELQIGGSDQWGNITAGIDLCRKKLGAVVYGLTNPLILDASGNKVGKTVAGAIWLDPAKTSVYRFYQYWIQTDDRDVVRFLKFFSFLSQPEIEALEAKHAERPEARVAHQALAREVTTRVHGITATDEAVRASEVLFGGTLDGLAEKTFGEILGEAPTCQLASEKLGGEGYPLLELLVESKLSASKGQARKDIEGGGVYLNNQREANSQRRLSSKDLLYGKHFLLRKGKRNYAVVTLT